MSGLDTIMNKAGELAGAAKDKVGGLTHDGDLQAEGRAQQAKAGVSGAGQSVKNSLTR